MGNFRIRLVGQLEIRLKRDNAGADGRLATKQRRMPRRQRRPGWDWWAPVIISLCVSAYFWVFVPGQIAKITAVILASVGLAWTVAACPYLPSRIDVSWRRVLIGAVIFATLASIGTWRLVVSSESSQEPQNSPAMVRWPPLVLADQRARALALYFVLDNTTNGDIQITKIFKTTFADASDDPQDQAGQIKNLGDQVDDAMLAPNHPPPFAIPFRRRQYYIIYSQPATRPDWLAYRDGIKVLYFYAEVLIETSNGTRTGFPECGYVLKGAPHQSVCRT
jgi:hypothetical protein